MIHPELAGRLQNIAPFHVMELAKMAAALEADGRSIINMGIGEPDFTAAPDVIAAAAHAMADGRMQYTPANGIPALRQAISHYYLKHYQVQVDPSRIVVTAGASAALLLACAALVEPGTEVLMPDPCYPCNRHFVAAFDGVAKLVACGPSKRFQLTASDVEQHWTPATRGVLLASPSNPTGTSIPDGELRSIVEAVRARNGFTIVDEIYQGLSYDHPPVTALSLGEDVIVINSFSKYFNMTGWRLGWLVVPPWMVEQIEKLAQNFFICASSIAQHAAVACFTRDSLDLHEERRNEFQRRRDYLVPALKELGFDVPVMPDGAFYVYADCSRWSDDADRLSIELLNEAGVVLVPGLDFGPSTASRYLRISYATSMENLYAAVARMKAFFDTRKPRLLESDPAELE
ncbi:pyridoxal phosphate-dependent aminotransferase [Lacisediminimonas profundi]|uniref:pyridoxal phosphate-dependent aminotransferase n=1 Tax=Lacisediminimonas profundi TaxID=2603856 RepID=UPI00124AE5C8|nr:pyridoxal phosphate-dependent aminotransferase [Lacisediminimonas profundi]